MRGVTELARESADVFLWRLFKHTSVAQVSISLRDRRPYVQLTIDGAIVFRCEFRADRGLEPLQALAGTTRHELAARGWNEPP